jgi:hypothetical protein
MSGTRLLLASARFVISHSWPVLAVTAFYLPFQLAFDLAHPGLSQVLDLENHLERTPAFLAGLVLVQALVDTIYKSLFLAVAWSRLSRTPLNYQAWRDWLLLSFPHIYLFHVLGNLALLLGLFLFMLPALIFFLALPFADLVILFEQQSLRPAMRRNLGLLTEAAGPAGLLSISRFLLLAWLPFTVTVTELTETYRYSIVYSGLLVSTVIDVAFLALFFVLTQGRVPDGFDFSESDKSN